jgi:NAD(P)-dependent dehydrogenase (short-subunit alcohol dehydrogenase family)
MSAVLVVGGTSGIGEATAAAFAERGDTVTVLGRDRARLDAALERLGPKVSGEALDGGERDAVRRVAERLAPVGTLVLTASGGQGGGPFAGLDLDELREGFTAKVWVYLTALQAALPSMAPDGAVVLVTAGSARAALPGTAGLAAINGALEAMVPPLAAELAPLRVNAVSPGVVDTPWWDAQPAAMRDAVFGGLAPALPAGRVGRPHEVAHAVVALATNGYITGSVLDCSGGGHLATGPAA